ncbi:MAG: putative Fe-S oxidoreductase [Verrucomicrobiales bacterium]|nr:putative Fe-S oxidoreductase [Verrucomicrobiales bacterium]
MPSPALYPPSRSERNAWVKSLRGARNVVNTDRPYAFTLDHEPNASGEVVPIATIFLTNKECPFRCVMCDLWQNTLEEKILTGQIPKQIEYALDRLPEARQVKLYNSGSFFDPAAIPVEDYEVIAARVRHFERVIVECHPVFLGDRCRRFRDLCSGQLEVAIGLESAHEPTLSRLNKGMDLKQFERAATFLKKENVALRVFLLIQPPFLSLEESSIWLRHSINYALEHGSTAISLIPTRAGNGAMERLGSNGDFRPPTLGTIEESLDWAIGLQKGRVFADLWDLKKFPNCPQCFDRRRDRLKSMNLSQTIIQRVNCGCGSDPNERDINESEPSPGLE